jgi:hypothetical protein
MTETPNTSKGKAFNLENHVEYAANRLHKSADSLQLYSLAKG